MKEKLLKTLKDLKDDEVDLLDTPALFRWSYPEEPFIQFSLMIQETKESNIDKRTLH